MSGQALYGTALIVDDDPDIRALIRTVLETETELDCTEAGDAFHALEAWHASRHDVVLLDHRIPGFMGLELARAVLEEDPQQLVILFSAYLDRQVVDAAERLGVPVVGKDQLRVLPRVIASYRH